MTDTPDNPIGDTEPDDAIDDHDQADDDDAGD